MFAEAVQLFPTTNRTPSSCLASGQSPCVPAYLVGANLSGHCSPFIPVESHGFAIRFAQL